MDDITVQAARNGDRSARERLLRWLQDPWYRLCLSLLGDVDKAGEATQETAARFLRQLPLFRGESQLRTWALGIAINVAREMRRPVRAATGVEGWDDLAVSPRDGCSPLALAPDQAAEFAEQRDRLRAVLDDLPERQREAVVLRFFEELSVEDTARVMECAIGTVKATVHQALRSLRQRLGVLV